tara:strand:+ start:403 stop:927 length:525 start_codon:yes stop_codon:yes gene_type:complete
MGKKTFILFFGLLINSNAICQKFGYVNTDFILSQMTEYQDALNEINTISKSWENEINDMYKLIEKKEISLKAEKILLTEEMYNEKRKIIDDEWDEIKNYQQKIFGVEGLFFLKKKELIEPIQDIVFESIERVAKKNRLQIVFDKSSGPVLLYTNPIHDYTDYVLEDLGLSEKNN